MSIAERKMPTVRTTTSIYNRLISPFEKKKITSASVVQPNSQSLIHNNLLKSFFQDIHLILHTIYLLNTLPSP